MLSTICPQQLLHRKSCQKTVATDLTQSSSLYIWYTHYRLRLEALLQITVAMPSVEIRGWQSPLARIRFACKYICWNCWNWWSDLPTALHKHPLLEHWTMRHNSPPVPEHCTPPQQRGYNHNCHCSELPFAVRWRIKGTAAARMKWDLILGDVIKALKNVDFAVKSRSIVIVEGPATCCELKFRLQTVNLQRGPDTTITTRHVFEVSNQQAMLEGVFAFEPNALASRWRQRYDRGIIYWHVNLVADDLRQAER